MRGDFMRLNRVVCHYRVQSEGLYLQHLSGPLARQRRDEGYASLLARPDIDPDVRHLLRMGRLRSAIAMSPVASLPATLLRYADQPGLWKGLVGALVETLVDRGQRRVQQWSERRRKRNEVHG
jgi:hypothetical protein